MSNTRKHYVGDIKWVLYNYVCDLNSDYVTFRCGRYAYTKLLNVLSHGVILERNSFREAKCDLRNLNGETTLLLLVDSFDKRQLVISSNETVFNNVKDGLIDETIYEDDIVLYFA